MIRPLAIVFVVAGVACWLWPGAIGELSARESWIIGGIFFVGAAILWSIRASDDKAP
jgi:hypothetical protein